MFASTLIKKRQAKIIALINSLSLCTPDEKKKTIHDIQVLFAQELFDTKNYSESMAEFYKVNTDPAEVIKLYPELNDKSSEEKAQVKKIKAKDLENAVKALIVYLIKTKANVLTSLQQSVSNQAETFNDRSELDTKLMQQLELIDTTLLKCYLQTNDVLIVPLLLHDNHCNLEESEKTLLHHGKHRELIILYQSKEQHLKALKHLKEHSKKQDSPLKGYMETRNYLQQLGSGHLSLIFEYSDWILKEYPEEGLKIFTEDLEAIQSLPRQNILDFLHKGHETLVIRYLEHVIHNGNDTNSLFHETLIKKYKEKITTQKVNITEEEFQHTQSKLLSFLENSAFYDLEKVLLNLPMDNLFEARAIVLGKLGRHEQALIVYILVLGDVDKAIRYAEMVSDNSVDNYQDIFITLMQILMNADKDTLLNKFLVKAPTHPKTSVSDLETALHILEKHVHKISPLKALSVFTNSVPLNRLNIYLQSALDGHHTLKRQTDILKGLSYAEHTQVEELQQYIESQSFVITDDDVCRVCRKRFRNQYAFVRYPNGHVVHFSCKPNK